jgi:hypothetical protein
MPELATNRSHALGVGLLALDAVDYVLRNGTGSAPAFPGLASPSQLLELALHGTQPGVNERAAVQLRVFPAGGGGNDQGGERLSNDARNATRGLGQFLVSPNECPEWNQPEPKTRIGYRGFRSGTSKKVPYSVSDQYQGECRHFPPQCRNRPCAIFRASAFPEGPSVLYRYHKLSVVEGDTALHRCWNGLPIGFAERGFWLRLRPRPSVTWSDQDRPRDIEG